MERTTKRPSRTRCTKYAPGNMSARSATIGVLSGVGSTQRRPPLRLVYIALMPTPRKPRNSARSTFSAFTKLGFVRSQWRVQTRAPRPPP
jgi:hypothetical protein